MTVAPAVTAGNCSLGTTSTLSGVADGPAPAGAPTVWKNESSCGMVATPSMRTWRTGPDGGCTATVAPGATARFEAVCCSRTAPLWSPTSVCSWVGNADVYDAGSPTTQARPVVLVAPAVVADSDGTAARSTATTARSWARRRAAALTWETSAAAVDCTCQSTATLAAARVVRCARSTATKVPRAARNPTDKAIASTVAASSTGRRRASPATQVTAITPRPPEGRRRPTSLS